ncbi:MAG: cbb3-type cytochrome c oxidase subunit I, partial [Phycisphaerae bacterium]
MTTLSPTVDTLGARQVDDGNYLKASYGFKSWAFTLDHKRISLMYLVSVGFMFLVGGLFAVLVRTTLLWPNNSAIAEPLIDANMYNRFFTFHGAIMVFIVIIPGIPAAMGNFVLPMMLGAKDVAF